MREGMRGRWWMLSLCGVKVRKMEHAAVDGKRVGEREKRGER